MVSNRLSKFSTQRGDHDPTDCIFFSHGLKPPNSKGLIDTNGTTGDWGDWERTWISGWWIWPMHLNIIGRNDGQNWSAWFYGISFPWFSHHRVWTSNKIVAHRCSSSKNAMYSKWSTDIHSKIASNLGVYWVEHPFFSDEHDEHPWIPVILSWSKVSDFQCSHRVSSPDGSINLSSCWCLFRRSQERFLWRTLEVALGIKHPCIVPEINFRIYQRSWYYSNVEMFLPLRSHYCWSVESPAWSMLWRDTPTNCHVHTSLQNIS